MQNYLSFACYLAEKSAKIIMPWFNKTNLKVETKSDSSPVTIADKEAENFMRETIQKTYPEHGIIGEEFGNTNENAPYSWVLDPIDGTQSFICGVPLFGTLIALLENKKPVIGIINLPALNELYVGYAGGKTTLNGKEISVRQTASLTDAVLVCTDHLSVAKYKNEKAFLDLAKQVRLYRNWGDCYMYTLLARGNVDIVVDPVMNPWDIQALIPVINGAGGVITDYEGRPPEQGKSIVAAVPELHTQVIQTLNFHPE